MLAEADDDGGSPSVLQHLHPHLRVIPRQRHPPPDERKKRVRQPVEPAQILGGFSTFELQVHPHVQELVEAQPGHTVHFQGVRTEVLPPNVEVALERCDAAEALGALSQDRTTRGVRESDRAQGFSISLLKLDS